MLTMPKEKRLGQENGGEDLGQPGQDTALGKAVQQTFTS